MSARNFQPRTPDKAPGPNPPPIEDDAGIDPYADWTVLPRSNAASGVIVTPLSKVSGGLLVIFDQYGLSACGLQPGARVEAKMSLAGRQIMLRPHPGALKLSRPTTEETRRGYVARLIVPALRLVSGGREDVSVETCDDGEALLSLAGKVVPV